MRSGAGAADQKGVDVDGLWLQSACLLSKYGFGDGDIPNDLMDALEARGLLYSDCEDYWHSALARLVREDLYPVLDQKVELVDIKTNHNPIRALTVDGVDVLDRPRDFRLSIKLTPEAAFVSIGRVIDVLREEMAND